MRFVPVTAAVALAADNRFPWGVVVDDEGGDDPQEFVELPNDLPDDADVTGNQIDIEVGQCAANREANFSLPPFADSPEWHPDTLLVVQSDDPLDDLSVGVPGGSDNPQQPRPRPTIRVRSFEHLDHGNHEEAMAHRLLLPPERFWRLRTGLNKIEAYRERFAREGDYYSENLSLIALSGWDDATRYSLCGVKNAFGRSQPCRLW